MNKFILKTITKMRGPLYRIYTVEIFGSTIFEYLQWRKRCGFNHNLELLVNGDIVTGIETYEFSTRQQADMFLHCILYSDNSSENYSRPWDTIQQAAVESRAIGVISLITYLNGPNVNNEVVFDLSQI